MNKRLLQPIELDLILSYPSGRSLRLAKAGKIPFIQLPDGEIRFDESQISKLLESRTAKPKVEKRIL